MVFDILFNDVIKQVISKFEIRNLGNGLGWRYCCPGIYLFGICGNKNCRAGNEEVIQIINDCEYDLLKKKVMMECPMCENICLANTVGFYKCYYNIYGIKYNEESDEKEIFGKKIPNFNSIDIINDNYVLIDEQQYKVQKTEGENIFKYDESNGEAIFRKLIFQVKKF